MSPRDMDINELIDFLEKVLDFEENQILSKTGSQEGNSSVFLSIDEFIQN
jgi:hypothetical protein